MTRTTILPEDVVQVLKDYSQFLQGMTVRGACEYFTRKDEEGKYIYSEDHHVRVFTLSREHPSGEITTNKLELSIAERFRVLRMWLPNKPQLGRYLVSTYL